MPMIRESLQKLGFSEKETAVYLTLLKMGPCAASTLARLTGLKRTSMYDILSSLLEKNFIGSFKQGHHTYFVVDDIQKIYYSEKEKIEIAKRLVAQLKKAQRSQPGIQMNYYKGRPGYQEMYEDILQIKPEELIGWMNLDMFYEGIDPVREESWTQERIDSGIRVRLILQESPLTQAFSTKDATSNRETRFIPKGAFPFNSSCLLYESYLTFFDPKTEFTGIRIHSKDLYQMQKQIFEMNWERLKV